jgi:exosortase A-associated hydrolase 2
MFLSGTAGRLFAVEFSSRSGPRSERGLIVIPPFAEEMNRSRPMMARAAAAFAAGGATALLLDLHATGDSDGDFREATVRQWRSDIRTGAAWLADRGCRRMDVLAVRAGALLPTADALDPRLCPGRLALWQPYESGQLAISQFLRLRAAGTVVGNAPKESVDLRQAMRESGYLEVAGYEVTGELVAEFETLRSADILSMNWQGVCVFELAENAEQPLTRPGSRLVTGAEASGVRSQGRVLAGDPFWATPEISISPNLLASTSEFFA